MYLRFAGKASAPWLGLMAVLMPAGAGFARTPVRASSGAGRVTLSTRIATPKTLPKLALRRANVLGTKALPLYRISFTIPKAAPVQKQAKKAPALKPMRLPRIPMKGMRGSGKNTHGGTLGIDFNLTMATYDNVEPQLMPASTNVIWSANPGGDAYPPPAPDPATDPNADPPLGVQMPTFLVGVNDFHMYYNGYPIQLADGEQFEPNGGQNNVIAFSAFLDFHNAAYKPDVQFRLPDGSTASLDYHGFPVRTINTTEDGIAKAQAGDPASIAKTLQPEVFGVITLTDPTGTNPDKYMPALAPDCSPAFYPANNRYIVFTSLRGYDPTKPDTHYTSLWVWDTSKSPTDVGYVVKILSVPGKSVLFPKFSADGSYLTYTEADVKFDTDQKAMFYIPDPVFDFDVTKTTLTTAFKSRVFLSTFSATDPAEGHPVNPRFSAPVQLTQYVDADNNEPRDMMSFFNGLNQIGFSSDRLDKDGDQLADGVETDPTKAKFDIYFYPFPYDPNCSDETTPDSTAHRQTLGDVMVHLIPGDDTSPLIHFDDSNELHGNAAPVNYRTNVLGILTPDLLYQADDRAPDGNGPSDHGWDLWETNRAGNIRPNGNILVGLPTVTPNQNLDPTLLPELKLQHRAGVPADYVNITVQVNPNYITYDDNGAPTIKVYALVKDPDNRLYQSYNSEVNTGITVPVFDEIDSLPVKFCKPDFAAYEATWKDKPDAPQIGALITLKSVDAVPDQTKPVYFTGKWYTPSEVSDFLIDVIVQAAPTTTGAGPGYITDNIGGFSTAPFIPSSRVLVVSDFMAGQKAMDQTTGVFTDSGAPGESYVLDHPHAQGVYSVWLGNTNLWAVFGPRQEWQEAPSVTEDPLSGRLVLGTDGMLNFGDPLYVGSVGNNEYDLWRVQCREPIITDDVKDGSGNVIARGVLHNYLPYTHTQPGFPVPSVLRTERVADRCVFWFAPHCGDLNGNAGRNSTQVGTIANLSTQGELISYMNRGGRLSMSGTNVAFVLAQNDPQSNNAFLARMKVAFQSDADSDENREFAFHRTETVAARAGDQKGLNPIPYAMWEDHWGINTSLKPDEPSDLQFNHPLYYRPNDERSDGSWTGYHMDGILPVDSGTIGGGELVYNYTTSDYTGGGALPAAISTHTPTSVNSNTSTTKTYYMAFNADAIHRRYRNKDNSILCQNAPAMMLHNTVDFFTTGAFQGQVFITNDVASPKDVLVYAVDDFNTEAAGQIRATAITDAAGKFYMDGLDPSIYLLFAYKTGFSMQHEVRDSIDTGYFDFGQDGRVLSSGITVDNITLVPTQPGSITGTVYEKGTTPHQVLVGVPVTITDIQATVNLTSVTDAAGHYSFTNIPTGQYVVTTPEGTYTLVVDPADATKNEQHDYAAYSNATSPLIIKTGVNPAFDIPMTRAVAPPSPTTIQITVTDATSGTPVPAGGAVITVIDPATGAPAVRLDGGDNPCTTITSTPASPEDGMCVFTLKAGRYIVTVDYGTFKSQTKTVLSNPNDAADPATWTKVAFEFGGILHTFTANSVLLASLPYDYTGTTTAPITFYDVLHLDKATQPLTSSIVAYNATTQAFVFNPTYPADTAHIGRGYGFKLPADGKVTEQGTSIAASTAIIRAETGWNLIGDPYPNMVVWNGTDAASVKVALRDDPNQKQMTIEDAKSKGYILSDLWGGTSVDANGNSVYSGTYRVASPTATLQPWQAYWVKAAQPLLFYVPQPVTGATAAQNSIMETMLVHTPLMPTADVWGLNVTATGDDMTDDALALGISHRGTTAIDAGLDLAKPTPISSGAYLYTAFLNGNAGAFATDVRGLAQSNTWTFSVNTTLNARQVTLVWTPKGTLPAGYSVSLVDTATGQRTNMTAVNRYSYRSARNGGARTFRVEVRRTGVTR